MLALESLVNLSSLMQHECSHVGDSYNVLVVMVPWPRSNVDKFPMSLFDVRAIVLDDKFRTGTKAPTNLYGMTSVKAKVSMHGKRTIMVKLLNHVCIVTCFGCE